MTDTAPRRRIAIDPNVRTRGNGTYAGFEDVDGAITLNEEVEVYEPESGLTGHGRVTDIDAARGIIYLAVDWSTLTEGAWPDFCGTVYDGNVAGDPVICTLSAHPDTVKHIDGTTGFSWW